MGLAALLFGVFAVDVVIGSLGGSAFLGDVGEMLTLFAASLAFVAAILRREAQAKKDKETRSQGGRNP